MSIRSFLNRFVHPWLAAVASVGVVFWVVAFLVAATGLAVRSTDNVVFTVELFLVSGVVGAAGTLILLCCVLWLAGLRTVQVVRGRRS